MREKIRYLKVYTIMYLFAMESIYTRGKNIHKGIKNMKIYAQNETKNSPFLLQISAEHVVGGLITTLS